MPGVEEIAAFIHSIAPPELAMEWDNTGLLVNMGADVKTVLVTLDITAQVVEEAKKERCQLILSHHPVIFSPMKSLHFSQVSVKLVKYGISALCAHTNWDAVDGGVNDVLAGLLGVQQAQPFGFGRIGSLAQPLSPACLAAFCAEKLDSDVRLADAGKPVQKVVVAGGSAGSLVKEAIAAKVDAVITGDAGHHDALDALQEGVTLVAAGHFSTEFPSVPVLADRLRETYPKLKVLVSRCAKDPFSVYKL